MAIILLPPQPPPPPLLLFPVFPQPVDWPPPAVDEEDFDKGVPGGLDSPARLVSFSSPPLPTSRYKDWS